MGKKAIIKYKKKKTDNDQNGVKKNEDKARTVGGCGLRSNISMLWASPSEKVRSE